MAQTLYCAASDLEPLAHAALKSFVDPTDTNDSEVVRTVVLEAHIGSVSRDIESALGSVYVVPITGAAALKMLQGICVALTRYSLWSFNTTANVPETIKDARTDAKKLLDELSGSASPDGKPTKFLFDAPRLGSSFVLNSVEGNDWSAAL